MSRSIPLSYCEVWQPENFERESSFPTEPEFFIEIYAAFTCEATPVLQYRQVNVPCDLLTNGRSNWVLLSGPLSQILVPYDVQPSVIQTIIVRAREISGEPENMNRVIIPLIVSLTVTFAQEQFLDERMLPTKKSAIEELEKLMIEGCEEKQCAICLEEIEKGCEATRMPCLHVYHGSCIVNWLQKSHLCPLCRFKMPVESS